MFWFNIFLTFSSKANQKIIKVNVKQGLIKTEILERNSHFRFFLDFSQPPSKKKFLPNFSHHNRNKRYREIFKTSTFILVEWSTCVMFHLDFEFLGRWYFVDYFWLFLLVDFFYTFFLYLDKNMYNIRTHVVIEQLIWTSVFILPEHFFTTVGIVDLLLGSSANYGEYTRECRRELFSLLLEYYSRAKANAFHWRYSFPSIIILSSLENLH